MSLLCKGATATKIANMRFYQLNLNHFEAAQELLKQSVRELRIDVALLSEPYDNLNSPHWVNDLQIHLLSGR